MSLIRLMKDKNEEIEKKMSHIKPMKDKIEEIEKEMSLIRTSWVRKKCVAIIKWICLPVDWSGGHSTPAGYRGHWRPRRRHSAEEALGPPRGKQVPGVEINRPISIAISNNKNRNFGS